MPPKTRSKAFVANSSKGSSLNSPSSSDDEEHNHFLPRFASAGKRRHSRPPLALAHSRHILRRLTTLITFKRLLKLAIAILLILVLVILSGGIPPSYQELRRYEKQVAQTASTTLGAVRGRKMRYLRYSTRIWGHGWNNFMQETLMVSYLAHAANRSYVYEDHTWSHLPSPWTLYDLALRPTTIPMSAYLSGGMIHEYDDQQLNVPASHYEEVCPLENRVVLTDRPPPTMVGGDKLIEWWLDSLTQVQDSECVEIQLSSRQIFDFGFFGGPQIHSVLPSLISSPILKNFAWSPLVTSAIWRNFALLRPVVSLSDPQQQPPSSSPSDPARHTHGIDNNNSSKSVVPFSLDDESYQHPLFPNMVAIHIRRGDYSRHCPRLRKAGMLYMGINRMPGLGGNDTLGEHSRFLPWVPVVREMRKQVVLWVKGFLTEMELAASNYNGNNNPVNPPRAANVERKEEELANWESELDALFSGTHVPGSASAFDVAGLSDMNQEVWDEEGFVRDWKAKVEEWANNKFIRASEASALLEDELADAWDANDKRWESSRATLRPKRALSPAAMVARAYGEFKLNEWKARDVVKEYYRKHCFPDVDEIVERLRDVRSRHAATSHHSRHLTRIFLLTNAFPSSSFITSIRAILLSPQEGWEEVIVSADVELDSAQKHVSVAVDMVVAGGAEVFVGNGFSSVSSNAVLLRTTQGFPSESNYFL